MKGRVLIIAGSDSGGGAGIQADIKAVTALGGFAMTAITALTAQNTQGVHAIFEVPEDFIARQIEVVLADIGADAVKIGMLHRAPVILSVADALARLAPDVPVVLDPVMIAKGGHALLEADAMAALEETLLPRAALLTPNVPEAEALTGIKIDGPADFPRVGRALMGMGAEAALIKGGHLDGAIVTDTLIVEGEVVAQFSDPRIVSRHTHGTGCTLASAIACGIAQGLELQDAVARARAYVRQAILTAPGFGQGHGPLNHAHTVRDFTAS
ncbi:MAG: bifunctional hydroxymethylpyrimidine kinase/phosphomethylpyrimidine kinase [Alphaproteobacteria bacterium]|nr:bifunctional hydroxymethylpyrimidine kinase/phosphomethylpyrimidine kinase [Alphaproteobacteria bacterium]MBF0250712.1 bifunctional hydroxymethylpyrimidine kinase/phosphomethylpyrimidine kinase [Alphaproteobacteria bacterium]